MKILSLVLLALVMIVSVSFILSVPVMLLWNWLMPKLFGVTTISFVDAVGLTVLVKLLFSDTKATLQKGE